MVITLMLISLTGANPWLDEGAALYDRMLYEKSAVKLKRATEVSGSSVAERRRAYDLLARSLVALGQNEDARRTFLELLSVDARAPVPADASPTIRGMFLDAKQQLYPKNHAQLRRLPSPEAVLTFELVDPWDQVARLELNQATREGSYRATPLEVTSLSKVELGPDTARCFVVARSQSGEALGGLGSEGQPLLVSVAAPAQAIAVPAELSTVSQQHSRWPPWAAAGATVALLAVGTGLSVAAANDSSAAATQHYSSDIRAYDDRAHDKGVAGAVFFAAAAAGGVATAVLFFTW